MTTRHRPTRLSTSCSEASPERMPPRGGGAMPERRRAPAFAVLIFATHASRCAKKKNSHVQVLIGWHSNRGRRGIGRWPGPTRRTVRARSCREGES